MNGNVSIFGTILTFGNVTDLPAELYVNGEIVQRSPERQRRVEPVPQGPRDRPRYNDKTRYVRRRDNMR